MTSTAPTRGSPLARIRLTRGKHEENIRRCDGCGVLFDLESEGQNGGEPVFCGRCTRIYGREP